MPPYDYINARYLVLMFGVGLGLVVALLLARYSRLWSFSFRPRPEREEDDEVHEFGGGVKETYRPAPWLIWLVFVGYFVWATAYVVYIGRVGL